MFQTDSTNRYGCYALLPQNHGAGVPYLVTDTNIFPETLSLIYALLISNKARASKDSEKPTFCTYLKNSTY